MIGNNGRRDRLSPKLIAMTFAAAAVLLGSAFAGTFGVAQATLIQEEEHWRYSVDKWLWDEDRRRTYGLMNAQIVIQNETADRLEGYVADSNGTRLAFYDGDQVVNIRYISNGSGIGSGWQTVGRVYDGYFAIDIPQRYRDTDIVKIYIGTHGYIVNDGTPTTPQTQVFMNSAVINYVTNSTLDQVTEIAEAGSDEPRLMRNVYERGSLIDWILSQNGMLSVRSADSGK